MGQPVEGSGTVGRIRLHIGDFLHGGGVGGLTVCNLDGVDVYYYW